MSPYNTDTLYDQKFADVLTPDNLRVAAPLSANYGSEVYFRWRQFVVPIGNADPQKTKFLKEHFVVHLDVQHFTIDEVVVSITSKYCDVTGMHNDRADDHGFVSRKFTRRFDLPAKINPDTMESTISSDGVLTISGRYGEAVLKKKVIPGRTNNLQIVSTDD